MEKPLLLVREEFIYDIINLINNSRLPLIIIEPILRDLLNDTKSGIRKEYKEQKEQYEKYLKSLSTNPEDQTE